MMFLLRIIELRDFIEDYALSKKIKQVMFYSAKFAFNFYKKYNINLLNQDIGS